MTALSASAIRKTRNRDGAKYAEYVVGTGATIYAGSLCAINTSTGRVVAATDAAARKFVGLATEAATGDTAGTVRCKIEWGIEALVDANTDLTTAYIGSNCSIADDNQVETASTSSNDVLVGEVIELEGGDAWVALRQYATSQI